MAHSWAGVSWGLCSEGSKMGEPVRITHPFPPLYDEESRVLILGSFPSVKSREQKFFYGHPRNRFWAVIAALTGTPVPDPADIPAKKKLLHENRIALWDVIYQCDIVGSSDSSIRSAVPTDLSPIFETAQIRQIFCNGATSYSMFQRYQSTRLGREAIRLPSTSPANAASSLDKLILAWQPVADSLH